MELQEALAVKDGRIVAVGSDEAVDVLIGGETTVVDLGGRSLLPGFVDAHTHFIDGGFKLAGVDLRDAARSALGTTPFRGRCCHGSCCE